MNQVALWRVIKIGWSAKGGYYRRQIPFANTLSENPA